MRRVSERERFWQKVDVKGPDDCWNWKDVPHATGGYGTFRVGEHKVYAHRYAFKELKDPTLPLKTDPDRSLKQYLLHSCDNRLCCNPNHLRLGTYQDNIDDMYARGRAASSAGELNGRAKLTEEAVKTIKALIAEGKESLSAIGRLFGASPQTIWQIKQGIKWSQVKI